MVIVIVASLGIEVKYVWMGLQLKVSQSRDQVVSRIYPICLFLMLSKAKSCPPSIVKCWSLFDLPVSKLNPQ